MNKLFVQLRKNLFILLASLTLVVGLGDVTLTSNGTFHSYTNPTEARIIVRKGNPGRFVSLYLKNDKDVYHSGPAFPYRISLQTAIFNITYFLSWAHEIDKNCKSGYHICNYSDTPEYGSFQG